MSTPFSRLREVFLDDREPEQALFCTYGLDAEFFEAEILPAVFPQRLALDRQAGSALRRTPHRARRCRTVPARVRDRPRTLRGSREKGVLTPMPP